jgi:hypothetical protein
MQEPASSALRKKDSSMKVAFEMMKRGEVEAVVSAGNSGAMMATGMFVMGTLSEVARPAILIVVPSIAQGTVVVDAGANVDCKPGHLVQFGLMGSIYAERILRIKKPRVGVLSNGEEDGKGNDLTRAASEQLSATALNYIGYTYVEQGTRLEDAEALLQEAVSLRPKDGYIVDSLGWLYFQKGDYTRSLDLLRRAAQLSKQEGTVLYHLAAVHAKLGDKARAIALAREARALLKAKEDVDEDELAKVADLLRSLGVSE